MFFLLNLKNESSYSYFVTLSFLKSNPRVRIQQTEILQVLYIHNFYAVK